MCLSSTIMDKVSPSDWIMKKQGYAGATNPARILDTRVEGLMGIGDGKTDTEKRAATMNRTPEAQRAVQTRFTGVAAHARNISRASSPPPSVGIAGRRNAG